VLLNVDIAQIIQVMRDRGVDPWFVDWYEHYLTSRTCFSQLGGEEVFFDIAAGFPQDGAWSPTAWNICFKPLLLRLKAIAEQVTGLADDAAALCVGNNLEELTLKVRSILLCCETWGNQNGLRFSASKTKIVLFGKSADSHMNVELYGEPVEVAPEVKYLGVIIDSQLDFVEHVETKSKAAHKHLMALQSLTSAMFGPSPRISSWL
jgi:hypothetical protein